jgi:hypothetical protein
MICAERAQAERDLERQRADALRAAVEELRAVLIRQLHDCDLDAEASKPRGTAE